MYPVALNIDNHEFILKKLNEMSLWTLHKSITLYLFKKINYWKQTKYFMAVSSFIKFIKIQFNAKLDETNQSSNI